MERAATVDQDPIDTRRRPLERGRSLQLVLATAWLLDGVLQLQQSMFSPGRRGLSAMLVGAASGNPRPVASSITWLAAVVGHHAASTDLAFAAVQVLLGLGIAWPQSATVALAASVPWSLAVWWFGEGLGGVLHGTGSPVAGGPGAVLIYGVLAVVLWPTRALTAEQDGGVGRPPSFVAAASIGAPAAKAIWAALWASMALLSVLGGSRMPTVVGMAGGEPGWLAGLDHGFAALVAGRGQLVAVAVAVVCLVVAVGVYGSPAVARAALVLGIVTSVAIWVVTENLGALLAGGATDPSSGPLLVVLALAYWPARGAPRAAVRAAPAGATELAGAP